MGTIFASAERVIAWLGNYETYLEDFRWIHEVLSLAFEQFAQTYGAQSLVRPDWTSVNISARLGVEVGEDRWKSYCKFFEDHR